VSNFAAKIYGMEKIYLDKEAKKILNERFGASNVSRALNYQIHSVMACEIRHLAMNVYGGTRIQK
jgi:hypothetical protein